MERRKNIKRDVEQSPSTSLLSFLIAIYRGGQVRRTWKPPHLALGPHTRGGLHESLLSVSDALHSPRKSILGLSISRRAERVGAGGSERGVIDLRSRPAVG